MEPEKFLIRSEPPSFSAWTAEDGRQVLASVTSLEDITALIFSPDGLWLEQVEVPLPRKVTWRDSFDSDAFSELAQQAVAGLQQRWPPASDGISIQRFDVSGMRIEPYTPESLEVSAAADADEELPACILILDQKYLLAADGYIHST